MLFLEWYWPVISKKPAKPKKDMVMNLLKFGE